MRALFWQNRIETVFLGQNGFQLSQNNKPVQITKMASRCKRSHNGKLVKKRQNGKLVQISQNSKLLQISQNGKTVQMNQKAKLVRND